MIFASKNIRTLYKISDKQYEWLEKIEEEYYQSEIVIVPILHKDWIEVIVLDGNEIIRFPISETDIWDWEMEKQFDRYCRLDNVSLAGCSIKKVYSRYCMKQQLNLSASASYDAVLLAHIYYAEHQGGVKEILYKAGLDRIAIHLDEFYDLNYMAASPAEIFEGLNMRTLRSLNSDVAALLLSTRENRRKLYVIQKKYSWVFQEELTYSQVQFWHEHFDMYVTMEESIEAYKKVKKLFRRGIVDGEYKYSDYQNCMNEVKQIGNLFSIDMKGCDKNWNTWICHRRLVNDIYTCLFVQPKVWNDILFLQAAEHPELEYQDDEYMVIFPRSNVEFCEEAIHQKNCVINYVRDVVIRESIVLFLRKRREPYKSFITLEVWEGYIYQAKGKFNESPDDKIKKWINKYALEHELIVHENAYRKYEAYY